VNRPALLVIVLALALGAAGCGSPRPSVILISIDSLRTDQLDREVDGKPVTPRLSALRKESLYFENTISAAPWTTPSMMTVMTGLHPRAHGVGAYDRALSPTVPQLAQQFQDAGYATAAIVSAATLRKSFGFGAGFDSYTVEHYGHSQRSSKQLVRAMIEQITAWKGKPFFLWVHLWDPHYDYIPPPQFDLFKQGEKPPTEDMQCLRWYENAVTPPQALYLKGRYEGEVLFTDKFMGDFLDFLERQGLKDDTLLAVMADHGEAFLEHGWLTHAGRLDHEVVHVPLMLRWPGKIAPRQEDAVVSTAQIGRTLLELVGIDGSKFGMEPALPVAGPAPAGPGEPGAAGERLAMSETLRDQCFTGLVGARYKYVVDHRSCQETLFDLQADPREQNDLAAAQPELVGRYRARLVQELDRLAAAKIPQAAQPPEVVQSLEKALRSIGYVGKKRAAGEEDVPECAVAPGAVRPVAMGEVGGPACPSDGAMRCLGPRS
jgi:arylsulfatase A-like enzyme